MKSFKWRIVSILAVMALGTTTLTGCGAQTMGDKPGDQYNQALSATQRAALDKHKNRAVD